MKGIMFALTMAVATSTFASMDTPVFHEGGYLAAKKQAQTEGKLQLIHFVAQWCLPCKHMEKTTFTDPELKKIIATQFASSKVDIDDFDGFALKQTFNVRFLPTMIVINQQGEVVARYEEAMAASALKAKLSELAQKYPPRVQSRPQTASKNDTKPVIHDEDNSWEDLEIVSPPQKEITTQKDPVKTIFITDKTILQFGVFSSLSNAQVLYDRISEALPSFPEMKSIKMDNGDLAYALQYGPFENKKEAAVVQEELKLLGFDSIIKQLQ